MFEWLKSRIIKLKLLKICSSNVTKEFWLIFASKKYIVIALALQDLNEEKLYFLSLFWSPLIAIGFPLYLL